MCYDTKRAQGTTFIHKAKKMTLESNRSCKMSD